MIELYGARTGNCLRVSVAMEEAGIPYEVRIVELRRGEHLGTAFKAINPDGKVPAMVETRADGSRFVLTQSNAIMLHLAERSPGTLLPEEPAARAFALRRFFYILTDVIGPNHAAFRLTMEGHGDGPAGDVLKRFSARMLSAAEGFLTETPFISGEIFGLADIAAVTTFSSILDDADLSRLPRLTDWYRRAMAREGVIRGMAAFDPTAMRRP